MMSSFTIGNRLSCAANARASFDEASQAFISYLERQEWSKAENARQLAMDHLESHLDFIASAYRALAIARGRKT